VVEWKAKADSTSLLFSEAAVRQFARLLGLPEQGSDILRDILGDRIFLDGLLSVWHGERVVEGD
jgi:protease-4